MFLMQQCYVKIASNAGGLLLFRQANAYNN